MPRRKGATGQAELVRLAIAGIDVQIQALQEKRSQLAKMAPGGGGGAGGGGGRARGARRAASVKASSAKPAKREVSDKTRRKLRAAAKRRWAKTRAEQAAS